ncbi:AAA family ATPase [Helicobacter winghamensis]|nr:AAA family ATPase [Helicobacter winghamensis]
MNTRNIEFENFRNLGIKDSKQENLSNKLQLGSIDKEHIGGLLALLGSNNDGKSNVLDGLASFSNAALKDSDKPDYRGHNGEPKLILEYKITDAKTLEAITESTKDTQEQDINSNFSGKTFGIFFTEGSLEKGVERNESDTQEEYCELIQNMFESSQVYGIYGYDEAGNRKEIRLILLEHNRILLCSVDQGGKALKCFSAVQKKHNEIKDKDRAIKLACKFVIGDTKAPKNCDDAKELREFLKDEFEKAEFNQTESQSSISASQVKPYIFRATLTPNGLETNLPKELEIYKDFDIEQAKEHIRKCLSQVFKVFGDSYYNRNDKEAIQNLQTSLNQHKELESLQRLYKNLKDAVKNNSSLKRDEDLQTLLQTPLKSFQKDMQRQKDRDIIKEHFDIAFLPNIVLYKENAIAKKDLKVEPSKISESDFFQALFTILERNIAMIQEAYEKDDSDYLTTTQDEINDLFTSTINKRFNDLYCLEQSVYSFHIKLDSAFVELSIRKNNDTINLERQSTGFRKFFNLFFNFLYKGEIGRGDIVLIDEPENSLSIPTQKDLRKFLKDYGMKSGILFIIATHSPYMLDITHLDEVRIVKALNSLESNGNGKGSLIINDFSMLGYGESDALNDICKALGDNIRFDETRLIFVEGIMDYNILNAYSQIYDYKDSNKLIFLPLSGLGGKDDTEPSNENNDEELHFSDEQKQKAQNLITFAKRLRIHPILLVDNDKAGQAMKNGAEKEFTHKLLVITLQDPFQNGRISVKTIETLFDDKDRERLYIDNWKSNKIAGTASSSFKNSNLDNLSDTSTNHFKILFKYLVEFNKEIN